MQEIKNTDIYTFNNLLKCCLQYHWRVNHTDLSVMHFVYCTKIDSYIYWLISEETVIVEAFPTHAEYINIYLLEILFWLKRGTRQVAGVPAAILPSVLHLIPQRGVPTAEKAASVLLRRTTGNSRGIKLLRVPAECPIYSNLHYPDNEGPPPKSSSSSSYCIFDAGVHPPQIS